MRPCLERKKRKKRRKEERKEGRKEGRKRDGGRAKRKSIFPSTKL
jgi:hypothetical protein